MRTLTLLAGLALALAACGGGEPATETEASTEELAATGRPATAVDTAAKAGEDATSRCRPFDPALAKALTTTADAGERGIEGAAAGTSKVKVPDHAPVYAGLPIEFVSIMVDGQIVTLAHVVGGLLWSAVDEESGEATGLPVGIEYLPVSMATDGAMVAAECAEAGLGAPSAPVQAEPTELPADPMALQEYNKWATRLTVRVGGLLAVLADLSGEAGEDPKVVFGGDWNTKIVGVLSSLQVDAELIRERVDVPSEAESLHEMMLDVADDLDVVVTSFLPGLYGLDSDEMGAAVEAALRAQQTCDEMASELNRLWQVYGVE